MPPEAHQLKRVAAGGGHSLFLDWDGQVWGCGSNKHGQVGCGLTGSPGQGVPDPRLKMPTLVPFEGSSPVRVKFIDAGPQASAAVSEDGSCFVWGDTVEGQLAVPAGANDPLFHHFSAVMRTWCQATPARVGALTGAASISLGGMCQLVKGAGHMLIGTQAGEARSVGLNRSGQLGRETVQLDYGNISPRSPKNRSSKAAVDPEAIQVFNQQANPGVVGLPRDAFIAAVSAGGEHSAFVVSDGRLYLCGDGGHSQVGVAQADETWHPVQVDLAEDVVEVSCGVHHSVAITKSGACYVWGDYSSSADHSEPHNIGIQVAMAGSASFISPSPLPVAVPDLKISESPLDQMDLDGDGQITQDEMVAFFKGSTSTHAPQPGDDDFDQLHPEYMQYIISELDTKLRPRDAAWVIAKLLGSTPPKPSGSNFDDLLRKLEEAEGQVHQVTSHLTQVTN